MDDTSMIPPSAPSSSSPYRVLARKYRPASFEDLIGHGPMVRTLENAFEVGRIAQAWMLTGVRGVGKTTTARILARALNYELPGEVNKPSVHLSRLGTHCQAIMEGRHVDVIEMDAASHTGISDIREITEAARYKPASARYKVYIIDEVHMLSNAAFNGLLKTLEEPPEHVKFIFATTEIRKVPITVLSRCQRFDLRRVETSLIVAHLAGIAGKESVTFEEDALGLIARAAEGSVRDSLTLLDQAIAHGGGHVDAETVRAMLGLADRGRMIDLFEKVMIGDIAGALAELSEQYNIGADPAVVLSDLAAFTHFVTKAKLAPATLEDRGLTEAERSRGKDFSERLTLRVLTRAWQILLAGIPEVQAASRPLAAADMVLVRLAFSADLPTPDEALKLLSRGDAGVSAGGIVAGAPAPQGGRPTSSGTMLRAVAGDPPTRREEIAPRPMEAAPAVTFASFDAVITAANEKRDISFKFALERQVRLVSFERGRIEFSPANNAAPGLAGEIGRKLTQWTGERWVAVVSNAPGQPTVAERRDAAKQVLVDDARADPVVKALMEKFPGAKIVDVQMLVDDAPEIDTDALRDTPIEGTDPFDDLDY